MKRFFTFNDTTFFINNAFLTLVTNISSFHRFTYRCSKVWICSIKKKKKKNSKDKITLERFLKFFNVYSIHFKWYSNFRFEEIRILRFIVFTRSKVWKRMAILLKSWKSDKKGKWIWISFPIQLFIRTFPSLFSFLLNSLIFLG